MAGKDNKSKTASSSVQDKYASAAQNAVAEQFRIDNFAPQVLEAVENDVKLRNEIKGLVAEAINEKKEVKDAINDVVDQNQVNKIYKMVKTGAIILATAIVTFVGTLIATKVFGSD